MVCAAILHLAFPRSGWWWLAPFALAGTLASWSMLTPRAAAFAGFASGLAFFALGFSWFAETAGSLVGAAWPLLVAGPAALEAITWAIVAVLVSLSARYADARAFPFVAAALFALGEWWRSSGTFGLPFSQLGVAMIDSPLRPLAAYAGGYGVTFATALLAASLGWWFIARKDTARAAAAIGTWAGVALIAAVAWIAWPARHLPPPQRTVAAVQGGIAQTVKHSDTGFALAVERYTSLTARLASAHPSLVLWPETVITDDFLSAADPALSRDFAALARTLNAQLWVGTVHAISGGGANVLAVYDPHTPANAAGAPYALYGKEQLVPFAEFLPGPAWLRTLPLANEVGHFVPITSAQREVIGGASPLICWESVFGDIAQARVRAGASLLLIATDDAWFGTTQGPYEHAQAASLRAVESGRWVLRAAATGVSGIIAPDGTWTARTEVSLVPRIVVGKVGAPADVPYARMGPTPIVVMLALVVVVGFMFGNLRAIGAPSTSSG